MIWWNMRTYFAFSWLFEKNSLIQGFSFSFSSSFHWLYSNSQWQCTNLKPFCRILADINLALVLFGQISQLFWPFDILVFEISWISFLQAHNSFSYFSLSLNTLIFLLKTFGFGGFHWFWPKFTVTFFKPKLTLIFLVEIISIFLPGKIKSFTM